MSLSQQRAKLLGRLDVRRQRVREGLVLVEGVRAVTEALDAGAEVRFAVQSERLQTSAAGRSLLERLRSSGCDLTEVTEDELTAASATESPQGVILVCREPRFPVRDVLDSEGGLLVLDALQDPGNVGTLIRSAVAFGFAGVVCLDGTADPWGVKAIRSSAGAVFRIAVTQAGSEDVLEGLAGSGRPVLVSAADGVPVERVGLPEKLGPALVVGNEGAGVRASVRAAATATVAVRMAGEVESLNAGIAGSILMYELTKERM